MQASRLSRSPDTARHQPDTSPDTTRHRPTLRHQCQSTLPSTLPRHRSDTARHSDTPTHQGSAGSAPSHLGARALPPGSAPSQHLGPRAPSLGPRAPRSKVPGGSEVPTWGERSQIKVPGCQKRSLMAPPRAVPKTSAALKICVHKDPPRSFGHAGTRTLKYPAQRMLCNLSAPGSPLSEGPRSWAVLPGPKGRPPRQGAQGPRTWERSRTSG